MERFIKALDFSDLFIWERARSKRSERGGNERDDVGEHSVYYNQVDQSDVFLLV